MANKKYHEIEYPKQDIEYWVVVDESQDMPHYFLKQEYAIEYAQRYGHTIVFQECFN